MVCVCVCVGMIDRDLETATYCALAESGIAPPYYGRFANGRIEGWIDNVLPLTLEQLSDPDVSTAIARRSTPSITQCAHTLSCRHRRAMTVVPSCVCIY